MALRKICSCLFICATSILALVNINTTYSQSKPEANIVANGPMAGQIIIKGLPEPFIWKAKSQVPSISEWREMVAVALNSELLDSAPPMLGSYAIHGDSVVFNPRFPLLQGETYNVSINLVYINLFTDNTFNDSSAEILSFKVDVPYRQSPPLIVTKVYPSADQLPENLLRFYIYFSNPMQHDILSAIHLYDEEGIEVKDVFLDIGHELWSSDDRRLTIWIDPGRIKRELSPNINLGSPLTVGKHYTLTINNQVKDVYDQGLTSRFTKTFKVTKSDRLKPDLDNWQLELPELLTTKPVIIHFGEYLDHSLATHYLQMYHKDQFLAGEFIIDEDEESVFFYPQQEWQPGLYKIRVNSRLEDLAGNNLVRLFDSDISEGRKVEKQNKYYFKEFYVK